MIINNIATHTRQFSRQINLSTIFAILLTFFLFTPPLFAQEQELEEAANIVALEEETSPANDVVDTIVDTSVDAPVDTSEVVEETDVAEKIETVENVEESEEIEENEKIEEVENAEENPDTSTAHQEIEELPTAPIVPSPQQPSAPTPTPQPPPPPAPVPAQPQSRSRNVTVNFHTNGGLPPAIPSVVVERGTMLGSSYPAYIVKFGYVFDGWFTQDGVEVIPTTPIYNDVMLTAQWTKPSFGKTRVGYRFAPNAAMADVAIYSHTGIMNTGVMERNYEFGYGFEVGIITNTPFSRLWSFNSGVNFIISRAPVNTESYKARESAIAIPAMVRITHGWLFSYSGFQLDAAISDIPDRNSIGFGPDDGVRVSFGIDYVGGAGIRLGQNVELDVRGAISLGDFVNVPEQQGRHLAQVSFGLTFYGKDKSQ